MDAKDSTGKVENQILHECKSTPPLQPYILTGKVSTCIDQEAACERSMVCVCMHLHIKRESPKSTVKSHLINLPNFCCSLCNKYYALCLNLQACFLYISLLTDIKGLKFGYKLPSMVFTGQTEDSRAV